MLLCAPLLAQSLDLATLNTPDEHVAFWERVGDLQQELPRRESKILLDHGYESLKHLALRDSIRLRNDTLRLIVEEYLDMYGFPAKSKSDLALLKKAQEELSEEMKLIPKGDSIARDSVYRAIAARYPRSVTVRDVGGIVIQVLDTETDFSKRCTMISLLRFEYEQNNITLVSMLAFLRHTYLVQHGQELGIVTGTTERERLVMYAREFSGCWGI